LNNPKNPKDHITPMITIIMEIRVALKLLKKKKKSNEVINKEAPMKSPISLTIVSAFKVRI
jgi:hypothetical protein